MLFERWKRQCVPKLEARKPCNPLESFIVAAHEVVRLYLNRSWSDTEEMLYELYLDRGASDDTMAKWGDGNWTRYDWDDIRRRWEARKW